MAASHPPCPLSTSASAAFSCPAAIISDVLAARGVQLEVVIDEGSGVVMDGVPPLFNSPMALLATAEKVYVQLEVGTTTTTATATHMFLLVLLW